MGSSAKKRKDKKSDFVKPKLKVGKTAPKPSNTTNTAFKARSIVLNQQSLSSNAPTSSALFAHQLSLLTSKQESQRKDALASLTNSLASRDPELPLPQPAVTIIHKVRPLLIDGSKSNRESALKLLRTLPADELGAHAADLILYIHVGLTHLSTSIRESVLEVLEFLLKTCPAETVGSPGSWVGTLRRFVTILGWHEGLPASKTGIGNENGVAATTNTKSWTSAPAVGGHKPADAKLRARQITALALFLEAGLKEPVQQDGDAARRTADMWPLSQIECHLMAARANPYGYLNLFGAVRDEEAEMYDDSQSRKEVYLEVLHANVMKGMGSAKREGGEIGRAAAGLDKVLSSTDGMQV